MMSNELCFREVQGTWLKTSNYSNSSKVAFGERGGVAWHF